MAWNGNSPGFASWNAVTSGTNPLQLSTNTGLYNYTTATSNYATTASNTLQTEINAIVTGGTTSLWANYPAISSFSMQGNNILDAKYISTLDLQVSSINGADINLFGSTVNVGGITITGGTINTTNITNNPAKGGGGGGGNNPTTGGSGNSTWSMINSAVGATMDTVSKTQQAIGGILNNTGSVLFQTYYAVETAGAIVSLANGAVQLATNAQAMYDTREQNLIAGPNGPPGQTSYVYETINGTTQFQFSTLGTSVYSVFRTTDQQNPNQTFGREIFTSTIIPAGSKVIRSVSDPYQFPIISTQLLSTTNYMQSFGQWHAILETDYNLKVSTLQVSTLTSMFGTISSATISSINGYIPISSVNLTNLISTGNLANLVSTANLSGLLSTYVSTFSNFAASNAIFSTVFIQNLNVSTLNASSITVQNIIDNYVSTTTAQFDVLNTSTLNANTIDSLTITTNSLQANVIGGIQALNLSISTGNSFSAIYPTRNLSTYISSLSITQNGFYNFETNAAPSPPGGIVYINSPYEYFVYNQSTPYGTTNSVQQVIFIQPQYAGTAYSGTFTFYAIGSAGFNIQFIQAGDGLAPAAAPYIVEPGWYVSITYSYPPGFYQNCTYSVSVLYQPIPGSATSTITKTQVALVTDVYETLLNTSNTYQNSGVTTSGLGNLAVNVSTIAFGSNTSRNNIYPFQFNGTIQAPLLSTTALFISSINGSQFSDILNQAVPYISATAIYTSSLQVSGGFLISTPMSISSLGGFDFSKTTNIVSTSFSTISSLQNNILYYSYNATIGDETSFNIGAGYYIENNNISQWASTILQGNNLSYPMNIEIDNDPATGFLGTGTFDVQRIPVPGNTPTDIAVLYKLGGAIIVDIGINDYRLYRFTKSTPGNTAWSYVISPAPYTTSNNNTFQIFQNLTDVTIATTDNLNINAGSIKLNGALQLSNINVTKATIQNLTATNIQFQSLSTINHQVNNEAVTNLYAAYINTSSININTQQTTPFILGNYSNTSNVTTYFTTPSNQIITSENDMTVTSANPSYTYTGGGTDILTFDIGGKVWLNTTLQTNVNWFYSLYNINNNVRVNISTVTGNSSNANFPANTNITNFIVKSGNTLGLYTSGAGFIGNITGNITLYWTSGNDFNTTSYVPWTGLTYQSKQQITQTVSTVSYNATCAQYFSSPSLNIYTNPSSNHPSVNFGGRTIEVFSQRVNGFITNAGAYGKGDAAATIVSPNGKTFPVSQYNCVVSQAAANVYGEAALALNEQVWQTYQDGGSNWALHFYCTTATVPGASPPNFYAIGGITMIPYDLGGFSGFQSPDHLGEGNGGPPIYPTIQLSTIVASTITTQAFENISLLAGIAPPAYLSTGSITVAGTNQVNLLGNIVAIGGQTDVDIQANTNNVNIVANSTITLQGTPFDNFQGAIITSTPTYYVSNTQITNTSLVFLTPASPIDKPYWVTYDPGTDFCINVSSLATPTVMNYWVASYSGYGLQLSAGSVVATGGTVTTISGRRFHTFTTNGSFVLSSTPGTTIEIMIIGGGGGGGGWNAGGGGAGNLIVFQYVLTVGSYAVTLGAGGLGGIQSLSIGSQGSSTTFDVLATALGGGGGGTVFTGGGGNGGCGGGGSEVSPYDVAGSGITGTASGTVVQNLATSGGAGTNAGSQGGGGGGGCTVAGSTNSGGSGGAGGDGYTYYGSVYGGGGGGGAGAVGGSGGASGSGGGGAGSGVGISPGIDGTANTGGGGGGVNFGTGGAGGSGICIVSYTYP